VSVTETDLRYISIDILCCESKAGAKVLAIPLHDLRWIQSLYDNNAIVTLLPKVKNRAVDFLHATQIACQVILAADGRALRNMIGVLKQ
jgi:hypothetical protein